MKNLKNHIFIFLILFSLYSCEKNSVETTNSNLGNSRLALNNDNSTETTPVNDATFRLFTQKEWKQVARLVSTDQKTWVDYFSVHAHECISFKGEIYVAHPDFTWEVKPPSTLPADCSSSPALPRHGTWKFISNNKVEYSDYTIPNLVVRYVVTIEKLDENELVISYQAPAPFDRYYYIVTLTH